MFGNDDLRREFYNIASVDQTGASRMVARAIEAGVNFFDTADMYSFGRSEEMLGRAIKEADIRRDEAIIATKVYSPMSEAAMNGSGDLNNVGLSRHHIITACEASLRRLGTDYIDLYQAHAWDPLTPVEETLRAFDDLVRQGKVRYVGCSNWPARHLAKALYMADARGWERFVALQAYYSLVGRDLEYELLSLCREEGLGVLVWSPLSGGFLSGKYRRDNQTPDGARRNDFDFPPVDKERGFDAVDALDSIAKEKQATVAQVALAWLLARPGVTSVIIGAGKMSHLEDNLKGADVRLSDEEMERLSEITAPLAIYPQWMIELQTTGR